MTPLRFDGGNAEALHPQDMPASPGGGIWCDVARPDLPEPDAEGQGLPRWLAALHPLLRARLRHPPTLGSPLPQPDAVYICVDATPQAAVAAAKGHGPRERAAVDVVLGRDFAITVHDSGMSEWEDIHRAFGEGRRRAEGLDMALYEALNGLVTRQQRAAQALNLRAEDVGQRVVRARDHHVLDEIVEVRRLAIALRGALAPTEAGLELLTTGGGDSPVTDAARPYFAELHRQASGALQVVEETRAAMGEAVEGYTSVQSTQMNRIMQLFTVLAVLLMPATMVASIYGMNFRIPEYHWRLGYPWALGVMGAVTGGFYLYVRLRRWL